MVDEGSVWVRCFFCARVFEVLEAHSPVPDQANIGYQCIGSGLTGRGPGPATLVHHGLRPALRQDCGPGA